MRPITHPTVPPRRKVPMREVIRKAERAMRELSEVEEEYAEERAAHRGLDREEPEGGREG